MPTTHWGEQPDGTFETPYYYGPEDYKATQQQQDKLPEENGEGCRERTTRTLRNTYQRLRLPGKTYATASVLLHRFYAVWPRQSVEYSEEEICVACVDLACKLEETPVGSSQIAHCVLCEYHQKFVSAEDASKTIEGKLSFHQQKILEALQFDTSIIHPFRILARIAKTLGKAGKTGCEAIYKRATKVVLDSYRTTVCIEYPPHVIAMAAFYISAMLDEDHFCPQLLEPTTFEQVSCRIEDVEGSEADIYGIHLCRMTVAYPLIVPDVVNKVLDVYKDSPVQDEKFSTIRKALRDVQSPASQPSLFVSPASPDRGTGSARGLFWAQSPLNNNTFLDPPLHGSHSTKAGHAKSKPHRQHSSLDNEPPSSRDGRRDGRHTTDRPRRDYDHYGNSYARDSRSRDHTSRGRDRLGESPRRRSPSPYKRGRKRSRSRSPRRDNRDYKYDQSRDYERENSRYRRSRSRSRSPRRRRR
ncbi:hypothetical protein HDU85_007694 [Gaertneriomyces sp. JEL0708]|nr:hypothetical protein HDU85_007694 [Gaertneriomyces sp. JEL0708]